MLTDKQLTQISKFLSLVLRHQPELIGLHLDQNGWAEIDELIEKANAYGILLDRAVLDHVVATNGKKRFAFHDTQDRIRASQGHSITVDLGYRPQQPPEVLFHGTGDTSVPSILVTGLQKRSRHAVHLSSDPETAIKVGQRHGKPVVLTVLAGQMYRDGFPFFLSENGVWLTESVPVNYLRRNDG